jgi:hypothetical protein
VGPPNIVNLAPTSKPVGSGAFSLVVNGANFLGNGASKVLWNGVARTTTYVSATQLKASILATDLVNVGTANVTVVNGNSIASNTATLTIAAPTLSGLAPTTKPVSSSGFSLVVNGTNFVKSSKVYWNGAVRTTTYVSPTQLKAALLTADLAATGTASVTVVSAGATTDPATFTIVPPTVGSLAPSSKTAGSAGFTLVVNGDGFVSSRSKIYWNGAARTTTFVSSTQLKAAIPASDLATPATVDVTVQNGSAPSNSSTFTVQ